MGQSSANQQLSATVAAIRLITRRDSRARVLFGMLAIFLAFVSIKIFYGFWKPILFGGLLALSLNGAFNAVLTKTRRRWIAGLSICLGVVLLVLGPMFSVISLIVTEIQAIIARVQASLPQIVEHIRSLLAPFSTFIPIELNQQGVVGFFVERADSIFGSISTATVGQAGAWSDIMLDIAICLITLYFALIDSEVLRQSIIRTFSVSADRIDEFLAQTARLSKSIILGTFSAAFVQAVIIGIAFGIAGIPGALVASAITFAFSFVPLLGSWPLTLIGVVYGWAQGEPRMIGIVLTAGFIAGVADNFVRVWVSAGQDEGHPLIVLISILGGINLMGASGVIFGPLFVATLQLNQSMIPFLFRRMRREIRNMVAPRRVSTTDAALGNLSNAKDLL